LRSPIRLDTIRLTLKGAGGYRWPVRLLRSSSCRRWAGGPEARCAAGMWRWRSAGAARGSIRRRRLL